MDGAFEKLVNEKMDNAPVQDVLPGFDKATTWDELSARLHPEKKRVLPVWWTQAAAGIAGILIGGLLWQLLPGNTTADTVATHTPSTNRQATPIVVKKDTVYIRVDNTTAIVSTEKKRKTTARTIVPPHDSLPAEEGPVAKTAARLPPVPEEQHNPPLELPVARKIKPVHLLDIQNENRKTALYHNDPEASKRSEFVLHITTDRLPDNNNQHQSLFKELVKK